MDLPIGLAPTRTPFERNAIYIELSDIMVGLKYGESPQSEKNLKKFDALFQQFKSARKRGQEDIAAHIAEQMIHIFKPVGSC